MLWKGVQAFDVTIGEKFNLPAMCIWNVHDFLAYGLFASCVTKGHIQCPPCVMDWLQTSGELQDKTSFIDPSTSVDLLKSCSPDYLLL